MTELQRESLARLLQSAREHPLPSPARTNLLLEALLLALLSNPEVSVDNGAPIPEIPKPAARRRRTEPPKEGA